MGKIMVSVVCFTYNHGKYIRDALEGFISQQTDFEFEVLIHDDASTDDTAIIVKEYEKRYPNIIKGVYQIENQYSTGSITVFQDYVLPLCKGKYIAFCEGDDYWIDKQKLQKQFCYMEEHSECSLVSHLTYWMDMTSGKMKPFTAYDLSTQERCHVPINDVISPKRIFHYSSFFFRKDFCERHESFFRKNRKYDYAYKILLATEGYVYVIPEYMSVYRNGIEGSWTNRISKNSEKLIKSYENMIEILENLNEYTNYKYDDLFRAYIQERIFLISVESGNIAELKVANNRIIWGRMSFRDKCYYLMKTLLRKTQKKRL